MQFFEIFFVPLQPKGCETAPARQLMHCNATLCTFRSEKQHCTRVLAALHHQSTGKMVKRWTVGQSHFPGCAEGPSCETEAFPKAVNK